MTAQGEINSLILAFAPSSLAGTITSSPVVNTKIRSEVNEEVKLYIRSQLRNL